MENGKQEWSSAPRSPASASCIYFLISIFCFLALLGCAAPGEPTPSQPVVPKAIGDLAARQEGDGVVLTFSLPTRSMQDEPLAEPPAIEIYRGFRPAVATAGKLSIQLVYTIPSAVVDTYTGAGQVRFIDPLLAEELAAHPGEQAVYMVRTRAAKRRASADSNVAALRVYPVPAPITDVRAQVTETGIELSWSPPQHVPAGAALAGYRVYRAEVEPESAAAVEKDPSKARLKTPFVLLGPAPATSFRDAQFEFGRTYLYTVLSVAQYEADSVESANSQSVVVTPQDTFPPAAPKGLVVIVVPATPEAPAHLELSWDISTETDLAGYHVYRSEEPEKRGERLTRELLLAPTYRDMDVAPARRYTYRVSAVDRAGNESAPSAAVTADLPPAEPGQ